MLLIKLQTELTIPAQFTFHAQSNAGETRAKVEGRVKTQLKSSETTIDKQLHFVELHVTGYLQYLMSTTLFFKSKQLPQQNCTL